MVDTKTARHFNSYVGFTQGDPGSTFCIISYDAETGRFLASYECGGPESYEQFLATPNELMKILKSHYHTPNLDEDKFFDMDYIFPSTRHRSLVIKLPDRAEARIENGKVIITVEKPAAAHPFSDVLRVHLCDGAGGNLSDTKHLYTMRPTKYRLEFKDAD